MCVCFYLTSGFTWPVLTTKDTSLGLALVTFDAKLHSVKMISEFAQLILVRLTFIRDGPTATTATNHQKPEIRR